MNKYEGTTTCRKYHPDTSQIVIICGGVIDSYRHIFHYYYERYSYPFRSRKSLESEKDIMKRILSIEKCDEDVGQIFLKKGIKLTNNDLQRYSKDYGRYDYEKSLKNLR